MNIQEFEILKSLLHYPFINQRILASTSGYSLGKVNQSLKWLQQNEYLTADMKITEKTEQRLRQYRPKNAIILAAGYGLRMIPINSEVPKGLIEIDGQALIERLIEQLHEAGVYDITIVVGFMKEHYEYLIDKYSVTLKVNMDYATKNNIHSLGLVADKIGNTYILPCDVWCETNPFSQQELFSWYMVTDLVDDDSYVRVNRKLELVQTTQSGNQMIGISYITGDVIKPFVENLTRLLSSGQNYDKFWEDALFLNDKMMAAAKIASSKNTVEINTFEQLREFDSNSSQLKSAAIKKIANIMQVPPDDIKNITVVKKGMTNRSFLFTCKGRQYMMRIPGEGTDKMINRKQEYAVYQTIKNLAISDIIQFIDPENGYKITTFWENARTCDPENFDDVALCMQRLRQFHNMKLTVGHKFDIFGQIEYYESLWNGASSCYRDYAETKRKVFELKPYIISQPKDYCLTHIDAVPDNFLFLQKEDGDVEIRLIDWEYSGMQDPHVDIAMFAIYSLYSHEQIEKLIDCYFPEKCALPVRLKIYCYIAACGLLWSNWCEYKRQLGVEFGEYSLRQYRYAKDYYKRFQELRSLL
ncbi:MAG: NTP transferase domain-containing protein [Clostridiales bacterium]|nr:NTP transferase domain-containing protein [Clostridiales bacterium]